MQLMLPLLLPAYLLACCPELHVVEGVPQTIFVKANYSMEVGEGARGDVAAGAAVLCCGWGGAFGTL
jgi:hypothetical protein